eukprot:1160962-Pelagomonas_calceolata.AAC.10
MRWGVERWHTPVAGADAHVLAAGIPPAAQDSMSARNTDQRLLSSMPYNGGRSGCRSCCPNYSCSSECQHVSINHPVS